MTTIDFDRVIETAGGAEYLQSRLLDSARRASALSAKKDELVQSNPHQWVAMPEGDQLIFAASLDELLDRLREENLPVNTAIIKFLDPNPKVWIL